jgi:hypothetical protein
VITALPRRFQSALAVAALLAALAVAPGTAEAGPPIESIVLGKAKGLTYRLANVKIPSGGVDTRHAQCPSGQHVTGGGVDLSGPFGQAYPRSTIPVGNDGSGFAAWEGQVINGSAARQSLRVTAICKRGTILYYDDNTGPLSGFTQFALPVGCLTDTQIVGGGAAVTGGVRMTLTQPSPSNSTSNDAWFTYFHVPPSTSGSGLAYAVCASIDRLKYVSKTSRLPGPGVAAQKARCPRRTAVIGGGVQLLGSQSEHLVTATHPFDNGDAGKTPEDGWRAKAANTGLTDHKIRAWAICKG